MAQFTAAILKLDIEEANLTVAAYRGYRQAMLMASRNSVEDDERLGFQRKILQVDRLLRVMGFDPKDDPPTNDAG